MEDFSFDVFVSYAHTDIEFARQMVNWIRLSGFRVWFDEEQLVPGSRFRAGLQQGLRESQHLVTILTSSYTRRPWTQRELDLFDLTAEHTDRRILAITIGQADLGPLDQVLLVHQRIPWQRTDFEGNGFWLLYCGLTNQRPGPRSEWETKGQQLIGKTREDADSACYAEIPSFVVLDSIALDRYVESNDFGSQSKDIQGLISGCLFDRDWQSSFTQLQCQIKDIDDSLIREHLVLPWAVGNAERSAVVSLAMIPQWYGHYAVWPFVDMGCQDTARWFLSTLHLTHPEASEVWFSWVVSEEIWPLLPVAANRINVKDLRDHLLQISRVALDADISFHDAEEDYNYGVMITPWNHFHLCWLALKLKDQNSALAHAEALCESGLRGESRAGRFITRLTNWPCFKPIRVSKLAGRIELARTALGLEKLALNSERKRRIEEIWSFVRAGIAEK